MYTYICVCLTHFCPPLRSTFADCVSRTANVERNGGHKWVKYTYIYKHVYVHTVAGAGVDKQNILRRSPFGEFPPQYFASSCRFRSEHIYIYIYMFRSEHKPKWRHADIYIYNTMNIILENSNYIYIICMNPFEAVSIGFKQIYMSNLHLHELH